MSSSGYHHGNLRAALVEAAVEILDSEGPAALSLRAAARRVGVSRQAPYNHFRDADHLLAAVAEEGFVDLLRVLEDVWREGGDERLLQEMGVRYVVYATENPGRFRIMFGPQLRRRDEFPELARAADRVFAALSSPPRALLGGEGGGTGEPGTLVGPRDPRAALWSVAHGLAHLLVDAQLGAVSPSTADVEAYARAVTETLWFGLKPPHEATPQG